jgi:hypothetical protein
VKAAASTTAVTRWVVLVGADRRYYVYEAKLAAPGTAATPLDTAATMYVFGAAFASWRDDDAIWRAARDTAVS